MNVRKNIRLKEYDYTQKGWYFITICTKEMKHHFGSLINNRMLLNKNGLALKKLLDDYNKSHDDVKNDFYQIMPNHLHLIIKFDNDSNHSLGSIVSGLKSKCTRELGITGLWQKNYFERVIRNQREYDNIIKYIEENPYRDKYHW